MRRAHLLLVVVVLLLGIASGAARAEEPSPEHAELQALLARLDSREADPSDEELDRERDRALELLSVMATSGRTYKGQPEQFVGARLVLQVGNVLLHRYGRAEDARVIARSTRSVYAGGPPEAGAAMQQALAGTGRGIDRLSEGSELEAHPEGTGGLLERALPFVVGGGLLVMVAFLLRSRSAAPAGVSLVDAGLQKQAQRSLDLGLKLLQQDRLDEALKYFRKVAEVESTLRDNGQYCLALASLQSGDAERASELVDEIDFEQIEPEEAYTLGDALERRGQTRMAKKVFEKVYLGNVAFKDVKERLDRLRSETASYSEEDVAEIIVQRILDPRYEEVSLLASGGMGFVFSVNDSKRDGERLALKVLSPFYANDEDVYTRFVHEANGLAELEHPNIIRIHDVFDKSLPYYTMDFHDSPDLKQVLEREGQLAPARVRTLGLQLCRALGAAHAVGVVHRDVKPANALLGAEDHVTLLDFGIAQFGEGTRITLTGQVLGSPRYMAPEQIEGDEVSHLCDVYAAGLILYELLTGDLPPERRKRQVMENFPPPPEELGAPADLVAAIMKALAFRPGERHATMQTMVEALQGG